MGINRIIERRINKEYYLTVRKCKNCIFAILQWVPRSQSTQENEEAEPLAEQ